MSSKPQKTWPLVVLVALVVTIAVTANRFYLDSDDESPTATPVNALTDDHQLDSKQNTSDGSGKNDTAVDPRSLRHQDMLSEDMKQSIRDTLLQHGPMEVIHHGDGSIELPTNGRFTQMPVAVKRADGSVEIKEYSTLPE